MGEQLRGDGCCGRIVRFSLRPCGVVHGAFALMHPAPHFFGGVRQVRCQQACEGIQAQSQRGAGGLHGLLARHMAGGVGGAVRAVLDQFDVIVAELPEVVLDDFQSLGMLVVVEAFGGFAHYEGHLGHGCAVQRFGHVGRVPACGCRSAHMMVLILTADGQCELGGVEQLDGQTAADLHLAFVVGGIQAQTCRSGPITHRVGAELLDRLVWHNHVALGLRHLLVVRIKNPSRQGGIGPRQTLVLEMRAIHGGEQPGADDVLTLRTQVHREGGIENRLVLFARLFPAGHDLRGERRGRPRIHDVRFGGEATGHVALVLAVAFRHIVGRIDRQAVLARHDRMIVIGGAVFLHRIPQRERHAEEALTGDQPIAIQAVHPVFVTHAHEIRMEVQFATAFDQFGVQLLIGAAVLEVPLAGSDDFERLVALLVEVRHTLGRSRLAVKIAGFAQCVDDDLACGECRLAGGFLEDALAFLVFDPVRGVHHDASVALDDGTQRQVQITPPLNVGHVTERTAHGDTCALVHFRGLVRQNRHLHVEQRGVDVLAEIRLVTLVIRVRDQCAAGCQQFRTGGFDVDRSAVFEAERHLVVEARIFAGFQLGLGHCGLEGHIPQAWSVFLIRFAAGQIAQERLLGHALRVLADGVVGLRPVDGQAEGTPQRLELLLILGGELLAQFDEVLTGDRDLILGVDLLAIGAFERRHEIRIVLEGGVHTHAVIVLHTAFGWQAVVVPAHRVEHVVAVHALESRDHIGMRVREHVAHVQVAGNGGRRGVDGIHGLAVAGALELVDFAFVPDFAPLVFETVHADLVGQRREVRVDGIILAFSHKR